MAEQLVIYLHDTSSLAADWVFTSATADVITLCESGNVTDLAEKNSNRLASLSRVTCIIPAGLINFTQLNIPAKNKQRALQAIPFAMEDQLAEDIELMHFAIGKAEGTKYPVASIRHQTLQQIIDSLSEAGIKPDRLYPDILCLPETDTETSNNWKIFQHHEQFSLLLADGEMLTGDIDALPFYLHSLTRQRADNLPETIQVYHEASFELSALEPSVEELTANIELKEQSYQSSPLLLMLAGLNNTTLFNLLQGHYQVVRQSNQWWKPWLAAAVIAGISLTLALISGSINYYRYDKENRLIENEINRIFKSSFPGSKKIVNARVQMENKLKQLKKGNTSSDLSFTDILISSAPLIQQTGGVEVQGINYHNRKLEMQLVLDKLSTAETLKNKLNKLAGIKAEVLSASSEAKQVNARIRLEAI